MIPNNLAEYDQLRERRVGLGRIIEILHFMLLLTPVSKKMLPADDMGVIVSIAVKIIFLLVNALPSLLIVLV